MKRNRIYRLLIGVTCALGLFASPTLADAILWNVGGNPNTAATTADFAQAGVIENLTGASVFNVQGNASGTVGTDGGTGISLDYTGGTSAANNNGNNSNYSNELLDQYHYFNNNGPANLQISGLSTNLSANTDYKLYLFGTGDNANQNSTFTFGGSTVVTNGDAPPANIDQRVAVYSFSTGGAVDDTLDFTWSRTGGNQFAGFNGFAITEASQLPNSIALNFVDGRNGSGPEALGAFDFAGVIAQSNWNNTDANSDGDGAHGTKTTTSVASPVADALVDSTGAVTGVTASWTGHTTWSAPDEGAPNADDVMMSDFLLTENNSGVDASVTLSNLTYSEYDVYVYFGGLSGDSGREGTVSLNGTTDIDVESLAFSGGPFDEATGGGDAGHYVLFEDVTGASFTVSLDADAGGGAFHMGIFGVQIVDASVVPAPAALPAGLALASLVVMRRRRR